MSDPRASTWALEAAARRFAEERALTCDRQSLTYRELCESAREVAAALASHGVGRGDRVVVLGRASRRTVEMLHAVQLLGAALCPLSPRATTDELTAQLARLRPRLVACDSDAFDRAAPIAAVIGCIIVIAEKLEPPRCVRGAIESIVDPAAPLALLCTSGTTGMPKAVVLSNAACHANALAAGRRLGYRMGEAWLATMPLHHVAGLSILLRAAIFGAEVVLRDGFDAERTLDDFDRFPIRQASLVPTMLHRLLALERVPAVLSSCCFLVGGAALPADLARRAVDAGLDIRATYGLTETASQVTTTGRGEVVAYPETAGRALDGVGVAIAAPDRDGYGEIVVSGPTLFSGYFGDDAATRAALRDGVLATGDTGRIDADGRLYVASRRTDLIVTGGENVRPEEVERALESHPTVAEAGVYGVRDEEWGHRVVAVVVARDGARIDPKELEEWCRRRLSSFKIPRRIDVVRRLPRTAGGKLMRNRLRDEC